MQSLRAPRASRRVPARLVIADDRSELRQGLRSLLAGATDLVVVGEAADGAEAVQLCQTLHPELVLTDLRMPVMDGLQATAAIKAAYPNLPIVVWSVADSALDAEPSYPAGADAFLTKDVPAAVLLRCIRHLVRRSRQSSRLREDVDHARRRGGP